MKVIDREYKARNWQSKEKDGTSEILWELMIEMIISEEWVIFMSYVFTWKAKN